MGNTIEISIPDYLDADSIRREIDSLIKREVEKNSDEAAWQKALLDDAAMNEYVKRKLYQLPPIVRASVYNNQIDPYQEIRRPWSSDSRRPVFMRGSREILIASFSFTQPHITDGWCMAVAARYLRMKRFTKYPSWDRDDRIPLLDKLRQALCKRHGSWRRLKDWDREIEPRAFSDGYSFWHNGHRYECYILPTRKDDTWPERVSPATGDLVSLVPENFWYKWEKWCRDHHFIDANKMHERPYKLVLHEIDGKHIDYIELSRQPIRGQSLIYTPSIITEPTQLIPIHLNSEAVREFKRRYQMHKLTIEQIEEWRAAYDALQEMLAEANVPHGLILKGDEAWLSQ